MLKHGLFVIATSMATPQFASSPTTLENLLTLKIVLHTSGSSRMMDNLHFPSLRSFSIGCVEGPGVWSSKYLSPFKIGQLRSLVLYRLNISTKHLLSLLRSTTCLESLVIDLPIRTSKLFKGITIEQQTSSIVLPMLSRLTVFHSPFHGEAVNTFYPLCFVDMVRSRWSAENATSIDGRRLSMVTLRPKVFDDQVERTRRFLGRLLQEGLILKIGVSPNGLRVGSEASW